jgi:hypothetical protein
MITRRAPVRTLVWPLILAFLGLILLVSATFPAQ